MNGIVSRKWLSILVLVASLVFCQLKTQASMVILPSYQPVRSQVSALITREMAKTGTVGLSIAVIDDQRVVWAEGFGWADKDRQIPAAPETIYQLASITKLFTVCAAMQLAEQEKLAIDKPIQDYLPSFSIKTRYPQAGPITARSIMTHHSGIPSDYFRLDPAKSFSQVTTALKNQYACFPPNYVYSYSNPAVIVLGDTIAAVSGQPYHKYIRENLLTPLGMNNSFFETEPMKVTTFAKSYEHGRTQPILPTIGVLPSAGLYSNTLDLAKFVKMIFADGRAGDCQVMRQATLAEMFRPQNENIALDGSFRIGLGWMLNESAVGYAGRTAGHEGHFNNYLSKLILLPDYRLGVIVLTNSAEAETIVSAIADEALRVLLAEKKGVNPPPEKSEPRLPRAAMSEQTLQNYSGYYGTQLGVIRITPGNRKLIARTPDFKADLIPRANSRFSVQYSLFGVFPVQLANFNGVYLGFDTLEKRQVIEWTDKYGTFIVGERAPATSLVGPWQDMVGTYELTGTKTDYPPIPHRIVCRLENGMLIIEMANPLKEYPAIKTWSFIVKPISTTEGIIVGVGRWKGDTVQREIIDGVPHYLYAGLDYRKIAD